PSQTTAPTRSPANMPAMTDQPISPTLRPGQAAPARTPVSAQKATHSLSISRPNREPARQAGVFGPRPQRTPISVPATAPACVPASFLTTIPFDGGDAGAGGCVVSTSEFLAEGGTRPLRPLHHGPDDLLSQRDSVFRGQRDPVEEPPQ